MKTEFRGELLKQLYGAGTTYGKEYHAPYAAAQAFELSDYITYAPGKSFTRCNYVTYHKRYLFRSAELGVANIKTGNLVVAYNTLTRYEIHVVYAYTVAVAALLKRVVKPAAQYGHDIGAVTCGFLLPEPTQHIAGSSAHGQVRVISNHLR